MTTRHAIRFSPRIGVVYTPAKLRDATVFRGGFGIYYHNYGITGVNRPGFAQTTEFVPTNDGFLSPAATLSNPFPTGILPPAGGLGVDQNLGQAVTFYNPDTRPSYSRRYTAGMQQRLPAGMVLELAYQYNQARGLPINDNLNFVPASFLSTSPERDQATINRLTANVANPFAGLLPGTTLNGSTVQLQQLLLAVPAVHRRDDAGRQHRLLESARPVDDGAEAVLRRGPSCWRPTRGRR